MSTEQSVQLVRSVMEAMWRGDLEPLLSSLTEDAVIQAVIPDGTPISGHFQGREGFLRYFAALSEVMNILEFRFDDYAASANHVVILGFEKARVRRSGALLACETATVVGIKWIKGPGQEAAQPKICKLMALADMSAIVDAYRQA